MLSPKPQTDLRNAKTYFVEHLAVGDYYSEGQGVAGEWFGVGAAKLGLQGVVKSADFVALCENRDPRTGDKLTPRHKTTRIQRHPDGTTSEVANRRVFFDWTISPPKSVSVVALVSGDERLLIAHDEAVRLAVRELETFARTRVRRGGVCGDRLTRNLTVAVFRHETSRALDPHVHSHCIVFNATHDPVEERWKALEAREMHEARKYVENVYYHEMARALQRCGYAIENRPAGDFLVVGVPEELSQKFSKRDAEIDEQLRKLLAERPELAQANVAEIRSHLAHNRRARKMAHADSKTLRQDWLRQMTPEEARSLRELSTHAQTVRSEASPLTEDTALCWAEDHLFDRRSVVSEHELWRYALEHGRGGDFSVDALHEAMNGRPYVRDRRSSGRLTTRPVISREWQLVCAAREGRGTAEALLSDWEGDRSLDAFQLAAARQMLGSHDRIILFRGGAGTGKSFTLRTIHDALLQQGREVHVLAPQRQQVQGLADDGMTGTRTVSEFLTRRSLGRNAVVIVDEAGQIGAKQMLELVQLVRQQDGRLLLSGDIRQHGPVPASDALRAMERYGRLRPAELNEIRRQDPKRARDETERKRIAQYRTAVREASEGQLAASFDRLEALGAVVECSPDDQPAELARHFVKITRTGESALIVSPTWGEVNRVNSEVRQQLQADNRIGAEQWPVTALRALDLTDTQSHSGAVNGSTPKVQYQCTAATGGILRRTGVVYPNGRALNYEYGSSGSIDDVLNRVQSVHDDDLTVLAEFQYAGLVMPSVTTLPQPGVQRRWKKLSSEPNGDGGDPYTGYDRFGRWIHMRWLKQATTPISLVDVKWGYNRASLKTWRQDVLATSLSAAQDQYFTYDGLYQVNDRQLGVLNGSFTGITGTPVQQEGFGYDETGNWVSYEQRNSGTLDIDQERENNLSNQITEIDGVSTGVGYDASGNMLKVPTGGAALNGPPHKLIWDAWNRLRKVTDDADNLLAEYQYDARTRRIICTIDTVTRRYYFDDKGRSVEERIDSVVDAQRQYVWHPEDRWELILRDRSTENDNILDERLYSLKDQLDPVAVCDASGKVQERYAYSAFGITVFLQDDFTPRMTNQSDYAWNWLFHGEFADELTEWYNYGFRYYSPEMMRWLSRDPIREMGGVNLYAFVGNNGIGKWDVMGLDTAPNCCTSEERKMNQLEQSYEDAREVANEKNAAYSEIWDTYQSTLDKLSQADKLYAESRKEEIWKIAEVTVNCGRAQNSFANSGCQRAIENLTAHRAEQLKLKSQKDALSSLAATQQGQVQTARAAYDQAFDDYKNKMDMYRDAANEYKQCKDRNANTKDECPCQ